MEDHVTNLRLRTHAWTTCRSTSVAHDEMPEGLAACNPSATDAFGLLHHLPLGVPQGESATSHEGSACQLRNGVFRGRLHVDARAFIAMPSRTCPACA